MQYIEILAHAHILPVFLLSTFAISSDLHVTSVFQFSPAVRPLLATSGKNKEKQCQLNSRIGVSSSTARTERTSLRLKRSRASDR
jgi:hypothetical protein